MSSESVQTASRAGSSRNNVFKTLQTGACTVWKTVRWALLVIFVFAVVAAISIFNSQRNRRHTPYQLERIRSLLQFASKSADEAERIAADEPVQALLHADYASCYLSAAKHLVDRKTIESLIGTDLDELEGYLASLQQRLLKRVYVAVEKGSPASKS